MSKYRIRMNGKTYEMEIELMGDEEVSKGSQSISNVSYKNTDSIICVINPEAERQTHFDDNIVLSPMPGLVIKVNCKTGDVVGKDEPILILEAMKMENEICAPRNGKIKEIFVSEGQTVQGNASLFELEE